MAWPARVTGLVFKLTVQPQVTSKDALCLRGHGCTLLAPGVITIVLITRWYWRHYKISSALKISCHPLRHRLLPLGISHLKIFARKSLPFFPRSDLPPLQLFWKHGWIQFSIVYKKKKKRWPACKEITGGISPALQPIRDHPFLTTRRRIL